LITLEGKVSFLLTGVAYVKRMRRLFLSCYPSDFE